MTNTNPLDNDDLLKDVSIDERPAVKKALEDGKEMLEQFRVPEVTQVTVCNQIKNELHALLASGKIHSDNQIHHTVAVLVQPHLEKPQTATESPAVGKQYNMPKILLETHFKPQNPPSKAA